MDSSSFIMISFTGGFNYFIYENNLQDDTMRALAYHEDTRVNEKVSVGETVADPFFLMMKMMSL